MSDKRYKVALPLSGGIGCKSHTLLLDLENAPSNNVFAQTVTPMQSMFSHLMHKQKVWESRNLKKLKFVWIQRDPELIV
jgi:hypothetical protein